MTSPFQITLPLSLNIPYSSIPETLPRIVLYGMYASAVVLLIETGWVDLKRFESLGAAMVGVLSMVVGLMVSFRSESSTARWNAGREQWSQLSSASRALLRTFSVAYPCTPARGERYDPELRDKVDEFTGLIVAFPYALKHHLRGEFGTSQIDLDGLLPKPYVQSLRRTTTSVRWQAGPPKIKTFPKVDSSSSIFELLPPSPNPDTNTSGHLPDLLSSPVGFLGLSEKVPVGITGVLGPSTAEAVKQEIQLNDIPFATLPPAPQSSMSRRGTLTNGGLTPSISSSPSPPNLPLSLLRLMESYIDNFKKLGEVSGSGIDEAKAERMYGNISSLTDVLGACEKINDTPIPLALSIHLHQMLALVLIAIPLQLAPSLGRWAIIIECLAAFTFLGVDTIGEELAGCFGHHANALPLDQYAASIFSTALDSSSSFSMTYIDRMEQIHGVIQEGEPPAPWTAILGSNPLGRRYDEWISDFGSLRSRRKSDY